MNVKVRDRRAEQNQLAAALTKGPNEVLDFFLPLWAGSQLGLSPAAVGLLVAAETMVSFLVRPLAGALVDRFDRGLLASFGAVLYGLSFVGYALATGQELAMAAAVVGGVGGAFFWVALRARVGEGIQDDKGAFSKLFAAEGTGTWIAFAAAITLVSRIDYRGVFWLCAAACGVAAVVVLARMSSQPEPDQGAPKFRQLSARMRPVLGVVVITAIAESGVALLLLLHLQRGHNLELGTIAAVFLPGFIVYSTLPEFLHDVVRKVGRTKVLAVALVLSAVFAVGLSFAPNPWVIAGMWVLSAVAFAAAIPVEQSVIAEAAGGSLGRGMAIYESATLLGATIGTFGAGLLYGTDAGWEVACVVAAVLLLTAAALVRGAVRKTGVADRIEPEREPELEPAEPKSTVEPVAAETGGDTNEKAEPEAPTLNAWAGHALIYLVAQIVLAFAGYSWPYEAIFHGPHPAEWFWNSSGHILLNLGRIWTAIFILDTLWTVGKVGLARLTRR